MRLAIDAANLARDGRGMGRLARPVVASACADPRFAVTLLADSGRDARVLRRMFRAAAVRATRTARTPGRYDAVWFPFNGMRYETDAPALVTINDAFAFTHAHPSRIARFREQAPIRRAAREAARVVTLSHWSRDEIARELELSPDRITVVAPAPDPLWYPGGGDALPSALRNRRFALVVGVGEARKNVRLAIDACSRALRGEGELLVIVGRMSAADRAFARASGVRCGEIAASDPMLRALYRSAAAVLVPSLAEGFGLVALEAMACGAAVVAADAAALPEATGGVVTLLDPHDAGAWGSELRLILDDDAHAARARARALAYVERIDRTAPLRRMLDLLYDLPRSAGCP